MLQNLNNYQWTPDLISYSADTDSIVLSTSYHVLKVRLLLFYIYHPYTNPILALLQPPPDKHPPHPQRDIWPSLPRRRIL